MAKGKSNIKQGNAAIKLFLHLICDQLLIKSALKFKQEGSALMWDDIQFA